MNVGIDYKLHSTEYERFELTMRKSVKREYELDRSYDYSEAYGFSNTKRNVGLVKKRSHKRLRKQILRRELQACAESLTAKCEMGRGVI